MSEATATTTAAPAAAPAATPAAAPAPAVVAAPVQPLPILPHGVRLYEAMWVVDVNNARDEFNKCIAGIKEIVEKGGGTWINADKWEERKLAYPIKKKKRALYVINHFSAPTESIIKIERNARLSDLILRHMILIDEDGLSTTPPVRNLEDEDFGGGFGMGGGNEGGRRFFNNDK